MNISEHLAIMDEIARKNNAEWNKFKRQPKPSTLHPAAVFLIECVVTFWVVILLGIVAIIAA